MIDRIQTRLTTHAPEQRRGATAHPIEAAPSGMAQAVSRGFRMRCAACGLGGMFRSFLQPVQACATCGIDWRRRTADDFPPYLVILLIGHIVAPLMIWMETAWHPPMWVHLALWLPAVALLALGLIQPAKGAVLAFQWWHWDFDGSPDHMASAAAERQDAARESGDDGCAALAASDCDVLAA